MVGIEAEGDLAVGDGAIGIGECGEDDGVWRIMVSWLGFKLTPAAETQVAAVLGCYISI